MIKSNYLFFLIFLISIGSHVAAQSEWELKIYFETGKAEISKDQEDSLKKQLNCLATRRIESISLKSYTDSVGEFTMNEILSQERLNATVNLLQEVLDLSKITVTKVSLGESKTIDSIQLAANRLVILNIKTQSIPKLIGELNGSSLYYYQKNLAPCNDYIIINDIVLSPQNDNNLILNAFPSRESSTAYKLNYKHSDSLGYRCYGIVYFFPTKNFRPDGPTGVFEGKPFILFGHCKGRWVDSVKFRDEGFRIFYDQTDNGYYVYSPCKYHTICCDHLPTPKISIYIKKEFRNNMFHYDGTAHALTGSRSNPGIFYFDTSKTMFGAAYFNMYPGKYNIRMMAQWDNKLWMLNDSLWKFRKRGLSYHYLDSLEGEKIEWQLKGISTQRLYFIDSTLLNEVKPTAKRLIIKDKYAVEAGVYFKAYDSFFPFEKKWFHRFKGNQFEGFEEDVAVKRGRNIFLRDDYHFKRRENKRRVKYKMKQLKVSSIPK